MHGAPEVELEIISAWTAGSVTVMVRDDMDAVKASVAEGGASARRGGELISMPPQFHDDVEPSEQSGGTPYGKG